MSEAKSGSSSYRPTVTPAPSSPAAYSEVKP